MKKHKFFKPLIIALMAIGFLSVDAQLLVTTGQTPAWYVENVLLGGGVTVTNITYSGHPNAIGHFTTGTNPTNLGLTEGVLLSTGLVNGPYPIGSLVSNFSSTGHGLPGDPLLNSLISPYITEDATVLSFNFFPLSDTIRFRYVFGSEEYPEFVGTGYNDVFGFFVNGPIPGGGNYVNENIALIPSTIIPVTINNVNHISNTSFFVNNQNIGGQTIIFDGFTTVLTAWLHVVPCVNYHIKIAIADAGDDAFDSGVFLEANSFGTSAFSVDVDYTVQQGGQNFAVEGCADANVYFSLPQPISTNFVLNYAVAGTATIGVDYQMIPTSITIPAGQTSTSFPISPFYDAITEGNETVFLIFTNACGVNDTVIIDIWDYIIPTADGLGDISFCASAASQVEIEALVNDGFAPFQYAWDNGAGNGLTAIVSPTITTIYTVTATDLCGYDATASVTVTVFPDPVLTITAIPPSICVGQNTTITAAGAQSYIWTNIGSTNNPITVYPTETTTYVLMGTDANGCFDIDSTTIVVNPTPVVLFEGFPLEGCLPLTVNFADTSNETNISQWLWNFGDGSTSNLPNPSHTYNQSGTYSVILSLTNTFGCIGSLLIPNYVNPWTQVYADITTIPHIGTVNNPTITFFSESVSPYWQWIFGDGNESNSTPPVQHTYPNTEAQYEVTLIVSTDQGCNDTIKKTVFIIDDELIFPNVITPNGDGINDILYIKNVDKYPNNLIKIFNRWGKLVFEMQNYDNSFNGSNLSSGTYYYLFYYLDNVNKSSLTIIRN